MKAAQITINKLNDRVSSLEEQMKLFQRSSTAQQTTPAPEGSSSSQPSPEGTLLLGDTNLAAVRTSDLKSNCSIRTLKDANIDLVKCWINEKLQWTPKNCILYCGLQDIIDGTSPADAMDRFGSLVTCLKEVNEEMTIYVCELVPVTNVQDFDENLNNFNNLLAAWCANNGVSLIKTNLQFRLGTFEVDNMCYQMNQENQGNFLNRFGVIRLLNIIAKQCPFFELPDNWDSIMCQTLPVVSSASPHGIANNRRNSQKEDRGFRANHRSSLKRGSRN